MPWKLDAEMSSFAGKLEKEFQRIGGCFGSVLRLKHSLNLQEEESGRDKENGF